MLSVNVLNVPGFGWFFAAADAYSPNAGPYRITSAESDRLVFISLMSQPRVRRGVPFSRLELRPLIEIA